MTSDNLQQNQVVENAQRIKVHYLIELSGKEWIAHWNMLWVGSAMADYLKLLPASLLVDPLAISLLKMAQGGTYPLNYEYAKDLSKHWFEVATPLKSVYEKAVAVTV